jgi:hypothetical protein
MKYYSSLSFVFSEMYNLKQIVEKIKNLILFVLWNEKYFLFEIDFYSIDSSLLNNEHSIAAWKLFKYHLF